MIFFAEFIEKASNLCNLRLIGLDDLDDYCRNIKVKAVATGSSNFSRQTYLGNNNNVADKGEADIFMYTEEGNEDFHSYLESTLDDNNSGEFIPPMLSKSFKNPKIPKIYNTICNNTMLTLDEKYLTSMLYKTLKDQLS